MNTCVLAILVGSAMLLAFLAAAAARPKPRVLASRQNSRGLTAIDAATWCAIVIAVCTALVLGLRHVAAGPGARCRESVSLLADTPEHSVVMCPHPDQKLDIERREHETLVWCRCKREGAP